MGQHQAKMTYERVDTRLQVLKITIASPGQADIVFKFPENGGPITVVDPSKAFLFEKSTVKHTVELKVLGDIKGLTEISGQELKEMVQVARRRSSTKPTISWETIGDLPARDRPYELVYTHVVPGPSDTRAHISLEIQELNLKTEFDLEFQKYKARIDKEVKSGAGVWHFIHKHVLADAAGKPLATIYLENAVKGPDPSAGASSSAAPVPAQPAAQPTPAPAPAPTAAAAAAATTAAAAAVGASVAEGKKPEVEVAPEPAEPKKAATDVPAAASAVVEAAKAKAEEIAAPVAEEGKSVAQSAVEEVKKTAESAQKEGKSPADVAVATAGAAAAAAGAGVAAVVAGKKDEEKEVVEDKKEVEVEAPVDAAVAASASGPKPKIYIVYYSTYGHVAKLAEAIKAGAEKQGAEVSIFQVPETLPSEVLEKMHAPAKGDHPVISPGQLAEADGILFGFPTRYGSMAAQMKSFLDSTGQLWQKGELAGKAAAFFVSTGTVNGGQETTHWTAISQLAHHGMLYVPLGFANTVMFGMDKIHGGSAYGASTMAGPDGSRQPTATDLEIATTQGANFTKTVASLVTGRALMSKEFPPEEVVAPVVASAPEVEEEKPVEAETETREEEVKGVEESVDAVEEGEKEVQGAKVAAATATAAATAAAAAAATVSMPSPLAPVESVLEKKPKIYIVYYSTYGHVAKLVEAVKEGLVREGAEVSIFQVPETLSSEVLEKMHAPAKGDHPVISPGQLVEADGILFGFPTRYGSMAAQMKAFFDSTGQQWQKGELRNKAASFFVSTGTANGGQETTHWTAISQLAHHGMLYVPLGYSTTLLFDMEGIHGGSPYGASVLAGADGSRQPTAAELDIGRAQGSLFARTVTALINGWEPEVPPTPEIEPVVDVPVPVPSAVVDTPPAPQVRAKVFIVYYSTYGHVADLAECIMAGLLEEECDVTIYQVPETLPPEVLAKMHAPAKGDHPVISPGQLSEADGILFGFPTRYGSMAAQMKAFFDSTGQQWQKGELRNKLASYFISTATVSGGQETTHWTAISQLAHHGMLYVPLGYSTPLLFDMEDNHGGSPYGASTYAGPDGGRHPSKVEMDIARAQGRMFGKSVNAFKRGWSE